MTNQEANPITVVFTESGMCLTSVVYSDWREIQDTFDDYKASLGPFGVDDLTDFLADDYGDNPPFDIWDLRGVARKAGSVSWAPTTDLPVGPGLKLGQVGGDSLRLAIDGYQFPDHEDPRMRDSWYMVEGEATVRGEAWKFRWQALTCDTPPLLVGWLLRLEEWLTAGSVGDAPKPPWLIEPNLQFPRVRAVNGRVEITAELDLEFLPIEQRKKRRGAGRPAVVTLRATREELVEAAIGLAATIARYPVKPAASSPIGGPKG